jgi:hypothetical protein
MNFINSKVISSFSSLGILFGYYSIIRWIKSHSNLTINKSFICNIGHFPSLSFSSYLFILIYLNYSTIYFINPSFNSYNINFFYFIISFIDIIWKYYSPTFYNSKLQFSIVMIYNLNIYVCFYPIIFSIDSFDEYETNDYLTSLPFLLLYQMFLKK